MEDDEDRSRLRAAAAGMDDLFEMVLPDAPGMTFVGGRFVVRAGSGESMTFSAGAADEDRERSFRRCVGEMVETAAQFVGGREFVTLQGEAEAYGLGADELAAIHRLSGGAGRWLPSSRLADGAPSCVPASVCLRDMPGARSLATSLGCAAGRTKEVAALSALLELVERDALALWWRGGDEPGAVAEKDVPGAADLLRHARAGQSHRETRFLEIASDLGIPVVAAVSFDAHGGSIAAGFAARGNRNSAACSALRELVQMEFGNRLIRMKLDRGGPAALSEGELRQLERIDTLHIDDPRFRSAPDRLAALDASDVDATTIAARMAELGVHAHAVDLTPVGDAIPVVKVVAPLLQPEPGSYITPRLARMRELRGFPSGDVSSASLI